MRLSSLGTLALAFAFLPAVAAQTARRPMTFADLQAIKRISDPQISPSGKWVLFSVTDVSLEKNSKTNHLWAVPLAGGKEAQLTTGSGESNGRFSPDGKTVMYSSAEGGTSQIWLAPWDDTAGKMLTAHVTTALATEADGAIWAPDSKHFLFVSSVYPDCQSKQPIGPARNEEAANCNALKDAVASKSMVKAQVFDHLLYRHWNQYTGAKHSHIFYGSTEAGAGAPTDLTPASVIGDHEAPTFSLGGATGYAISPDGKEIAYVVNLDKVPAESTNNDIFTLQLGAEPSTAKKVSTSPGSDDGPQYSPDGKYLAWRSQARGGFESDKFSLLLFNRSNGTVADAMPNFSRSVDEFAWSPSSTQIFVTAARFGEEPIYSITLGEALVMELTKSAEYGSLQVAPDGTHLVATRMTVANPGQITSLNLKGPESSVRTAGCSRPVGSNAPCFDFRPEQAIEFLSQGVATTLDLSSMDSFRFQSIGNNEVQGFLIRPPNFDATRKYPLKFLIHGGPQGAWGDAWSYRWNPELFAANGYVVIMINPRGSTGYGQKFTDEVSGDWGSRAYEDLMRGLDYAEAKYPFIDKTRECALGASYGGYMANWILTHTDRFKCIVTHDGMYNPQSAFGTTEELWFNEWEFREKGANGVVNQTKPARPWDYFNASNEADPFRKYSPMLHIKDAHTPTLVIHGQRDYRLDVSEGFQLFTALQLLNVPSKMLYFPDEGHWVLKPQNSQLWHETVNDWCDRWTGTNKYADFGPEKNPAATRH